MLLSLFVPVSIEWANSILIRLSHLMRNETTVSSLPPKIKWVEFVCLVRHPGGVLPGVDYLVNDFIHADALFHLRKNKRAGAAHLFGVVFHHF